MVNPLNGVSVTGTGPIRDVDVPMGSAEAAPLVATPTPDAPAETPADPRDRDATLSRARFGSAVRKVDIDQIVVPDAPGEEPVRTHHRGHGHSLKKQQFHGFRLAGMVDLANAPPRLVKKLFGLKLHKKGLSNQRTAVNQQIGSLGAQLRAAPQGSQLAIDLKFQMSSLSQESQMLGLQEQDCDQDIQDCMTEIAFAD